MSETVETPVFEHWAIVEMMGHRKLGGRVTEALIAGAKFLQISFYNVSGNLYATQFISPQSVYAITPVAKEIAVGFGIKHPIAPVEPWEVDFPQLPSIQATFDDGNNGDYEEAF